MCIAACYLVNMRRKLGSRAPLLMYPKLARKLVEKGDFELIQLSIGMQAPLVDAIRFLAERKDKSVIPLLKKLQVRYAPERMGLKRSGRATGDTNKTEADVYKEVGDALKVLQK